MATKKKKAAPEAAEAVEQTAADAEAATPTAAPETPEADAGNFDRATLKTLSTEALNALAENMGVPVPDPEDREALIDIIAGEDATPSVPDGAGDAEPPEAQAPPPEAQSVPAEPEPETPSPEQATPPYEAVTVPALLVARREPDGPAVATLPHGATIRVTGRRDGYAQMENGLYVREGMIRPV